jgi:hypothetical protein
MEIITERIKQALINCQDSLKLQRNELGELYHFILANTPEPKMQKWNVYQYDRKETELKTVPAGVLVDERHWKLIHSFELPI